MVTKLFVPERRIVVPKPPSYLKLDMAFAIGAGAKLMDKSRYRSHGTISGATWADGAHGRCLDFNPATPSYVEIPAAYTQLNFIAEDFSIIARIYIDAYPDHLFLFSRGLDNTDGYAILLINNGGIEFRTSQAAAIQSSNAAAATITTGTWYTLGFSRDGATVTIYKNGVDTDNTHGTHINPAKCTRSAKIGIYDNKSTRPFDGKIEFYRIFGGIALPASAHLAWHNALA